MIGIGVELVALDRSSRPVTTPLAGFENGMVPRLPAVIENRSETARGVCSMAAIPPPGNPSEHPLSSRMVFGITASLAKVDPKERWRARVASCYGLPSRRFSD
jgi:hypothetical protein